MSEYPNWFASSQSNFEKHLSSYKGKPNLKFLQLGVFTGDASVWLLDNVLTDPSSKLDDVDTWDGSDEEVHHAMDFADVYKTYCSKTQEYKNVSSHQVDTVTYLAERRKEIYDFIYIDADHTATSVINDAIHSWRTLKSDGIMAFDDFNWKHEDGMLYMPFRAIEFFCWAFQSKLEVLDMNNQVWVRKL